MEGAGAYRPHATGVPCAAAHLTRVTGALAAGSEGTTRTTAPSLAAAGAGGHHRAQGLVRAALVVVATAAVTAEIARGTALLVAASHATRPHVSASRATVMAC